MITIGTQGILFARINFSPPRRHTDMTGIAVPEQKLQLMNGQDADTIMTFIRPPFESTLGQSLLA
jgi:hypothetical protein